MYYQMVRTRVTSTKLFRGQIVFEEALSVEVLSVLLSMSTHCPVDRTTPHGKSKLYNNVSSSGVQANSEPRTYPMIP